MADIRNAQLNITSNATPSPASITLSGTARPAGSAVSLSPSSLLFNTAFGTTTSPQVVTITNTGQGNLTVSAVAITGNDPSSFTISVDNATGQTITPGGNRTVSVRFAPTGISTFNAALSFTDNATGSPHTIPIQGIGVSPSVVPLQKTVYAFYYPSFGLSSLEGFSGESYQGWGGTYPAPRSSGNTHTFAPSSSIASDFYPADYWTGASGYPPLLYSSSSTSTLLAQCKLAIQAGINVLIVNWAPPPDRSNTLVSAILNAAQTATTQTGKPLFIAFAITPWATSSFTDPVGPTVITGGRNNTNLWNAVNYINATYGSHPNFYKTSRVGLNFAGSVSGVNTFFLRNPAIDNPTDNNTVTPSVAYWTTSTDKIHNVSNVPGQGLVIGESFQAADCNTQHFDGGFSNMSLSATTDPYQYIRAYQLSFPPTAISVPVVTPGYSALRTQVIPPVRQARGTSSSGGTTPTLWWGVSVNNVPAIAPAEALMGRPYTSSRFNQQITTASNSSSQSSYDAGRHYNYRNANSQTAPDVNGNKNPVLWSEVAAGLWDTQYIIPLANNIKNDSRWNAARPFVFCFHHEQTIDNGTAQVGYPTDGTTQDYINAYRHVRNVFDAQGVTVTTKNGAANGGNTIFSYVIFQGMIFAPGAGASYTDFDPQLGSTPAPAGTKYYELFGFDLYNDWLTTKNDMKYGQDAHAVFDPIRAAAVARGVNFIVPECGIGDGTTQASHTAKANFLTSMKNVLKGYGSVGPGICEAVMWTIGEDPTEAIGTSPEAQAAYIDMANDPYFTAGLSAPPPTGPTSFYFNDQMGDANNVAGWDIAIESFNNWPSGTQIEPATVAG